MERMGLYNLCRGLSARPLLNCAIFLFDSKNEKGFVVCKDWLQNLFSTTGIQQQKIELFPLLFLSLLLFGQCQFNRVFICAVECFLLCCLSVS